MGKRTRHCWGCNRTVPRPHISGERECLENQQEELLTGTGWVKTYWNVKSLLKKHFCKKHITEGSDGAKLWVREELGFLIKNFKGPCLDFLVGQYENDQGFRAQYENLFSLTKRDDYAKSKKEALRFALEEYIYSDAIRVKHNDFISVTTDLIEARRRLRLAIKSGKTTIEEPYVNEEESVSKIEIDYSAVKEMIYVIDRLVHIIEDDARRYGKA